MVGGGWRVQKIALGRLPLLPDIVVLLISSSYICSTDVSLVQGWTLPVVLVAGSCQPERILRPWISPLAPGDLRA